MMHAKNPTAGGAAGLDKTSFPGGIDCPSNAPKAAPAQAEKRNPRAVAAMRLRRQRLVEHLHRLGPSPLGHFIHEVEMSTGTDVTARLETYAALDREFIKALGGDKFPPPFLRLIDGGEA